MYKGLFLTFEGTDGVGKSTQAEKFMSYLTNDLKVEFKFLHFPNADKPLGKLIYDKLDKRIKMSSLSMPYLFAADRVDARDEINDYLQKGGLLFTDRYSHSNVPFQVPKLEKEFEDRDACLRWIVSLEKNFVRMPDHLFYFSMDPAQALARIGKGDEYEKLDNQNKVKNIYDLMYDIAKSGRDIFEGGTQWHKIDASKTEEDVYEQIMKEMKPILNDYLVRLKSQ